MSQIRRTADRRRRVLYQTHVSPHPASSRANHLSDEETRAARQPDQEFGSRVHRHLRGRWFSLVPVSRLAIVVVTSIVLVVPAALTLLHHLAFTWPTLAYREEIARPLYINRPDSFAAWWVTMVLLLSAGATRLTYLLRLHRRDDYRGHYQLWRLTLVVLLVACVHSTVDVVAWTGAWLDLLVGDRAVLSGANWLRIGLDIGGIILAMRLVAEVYRCRPALIAMLSAAFFLGISEAASWQLIAVDSVAKATLFTAAPMLGWSCFLVASTVYLRLMYRQVRNIPDAPTFRQRMNDWMEERRHRDDEIESDFFETKPLRKPAIARATTKRPAVAQDDAPQRSQPSNKVTRKETNRDRSPDEESGDEKPSKPGLLSRILRRKPKQSDDAESDAESEATVATSRRERRKELRDERKAEKARKKAGKKDAEDDTDEKPKRRWLGLRAAKKPVEENGQDTSGSAEESSDATPKKKRRFSLRLKPQASAGDQAGGDAKDAASAESQPDQEDQAARKKGGLFSGLFGRKKASGDDHSESDNDEASIFRTDEFLQLSAVPRSGDQCGKDEPQTGRKTNAADTRRPSRLVPQRRRRSAGSGRNRLELDVQVRASADAEATQTERAGGISPSNERPVVISCRIPTRHVSTQDS